MPNDLGAYLVIVLPIAIGYFVTSLGLLRSDRPFPRSEGRRDQGSPRKSSDKSGSGGSEQSWRERSKERRSAFPTKLMVVLGGILCAMGANLALTLTRAAWIGVFAATLYIAIYFQRKLLWGLLALALLSPFLMPQTVKDRFETIRQRPSGFMSGASPMVENIRSINSKVSNHRHWFGKVSL